jgi:toxin HigB-1
VGIGAQHLTGSPAAPVDLRSPHALHGRALLYHGFRDTMIFRFDNHRLFRMASEADYDGGFSHQLAESFRQRVQFIRDARDERVFYQWKALHFERLKGKRSHQRSMRLNKQFRLIIEVQHSAQGNVLILKEIEDYH